MPQEKTPGVYIEEKNAFPTSVVEVPTAVPAFIGYTEKAQRGTKDLTNVPTRISSLVEFELLFGKAPKTKLKVEDDSVTVIPETQFFLYYGMRLFFNNGGGPCWIVSVGKYVDQGNPVTKSAGDFDKAWPALVKEQEPTMIVVPDAVLLSNEDWANVCGKAYTHCTTLLSRIAILDVYEGYKPRTHADDDVISSETGFRTLIKPEPASYAVAYYPWVNTNIVEAADLDYTRLDDSSRSALAEKVTNDLSERQQQSATDLISQITAADAEQKVVERNHNSLLALSETYRNTMAAALQAINMMPPSAAIAGVYTRIDNTQGVFKAPANTGIASVLSPTVTISHEDQEDLNVPIEGKAINAIRTFLGRGVLIWGARTLDGNSQDWRYINVRRTLIMLEQSIKAAAEAYVFAPNNASTWVTVSNMIGNFLNNQWKAGALVGATPAEAYSVSVGLGSTMTANDILDGYMRVTVKVAVVRPAEFIVITFQQKMQTS